MARHQAMAISHSLVHVTEMLTPVLGLAADPGSCEYTAALFDLMFAPADSTWEKAKEAAPPAQPRHAQSSVWCAHQHVVAGGMGKW